MPSVYRDNELRQYYPGVEIGNGCVVRNPEFLRIAPGVTVNHDTVIASFPESGMIKYAPHIEIGEGAFIGPYNDFSCYHGIKIGKHVMTAAYVLITDVDHGYENVEIPIIRQPMTSQGEIALGDGCWIGYRACILSGVTIGRNSVIGANSVVNRNVPDFSVAAGNPVRIIKQYNHKKKKWEKVSRWKKLRKTFGL